MDFVFLLAFLVLFLLLPPVLGFNYYSASTCPQNFVCHYQLYSESPSSNSLQSDSCGLCMVICKNSSLPKINLDPSSNQWFNVVEDFKNNVIKLHDPRLQSLLRDQECNTFDNYMQFPKGYGSISYAIVGNSTLFRCSKLPIPSKETDFQFHGYRKYSTCRDFDVYYMAPGYDGAGFGTESSIPQGCSTIQLPVHPSREVSNSSNLFELLTADFELEWHTPNNCSRSCAEEGNSEFPCPKDEIMRTKNSRLGRSNLRIILLIATGAVAVLVGILFFFCFRRKLPFSEFFSLLKDKTNHNHDVEAILKKYGSVTPKRYYYSELKKMTNSFEIKIGQGGYGSVYKGKSQCGTPVAVKLLTNNKESNNKKGNGEEFINEVASISRTSHVNIVTLLGFCYQGNKKALVYEFMENGSLDKFIYNQQLDWPTLYRIAIGIARGLEYLHRGCNTKILHFDIKPHNILLDKDFCPKISDFGLAKLCPGKESAALSSLLTTVARGTIGYIAPEVIYRSIGGVSHKSDVYSYGMMVLEMVGGSENVNVGTNCSSEEYFPDWIYKRVDDHQGLGLPGMMLDGGGGEENQNLARKMIIVSLWCIQTHPSNRPTITNVLDMLEGPLDALRIHPKPFFSSPSRASPSSSTIEPFSC